GHPTPLAMSAETPPRHFQRVIEPESLGAVTEVHAEVAVVGTGAGGAAVAAALAEKGVAVAILEEGRYLRRHHFVGNAADRMRSLWRYAGTNFALGTPLLLPVGRMVGGTTAINSGTCFTTPDAVLEQWQATLGFPADFAPAQFHRYSQRVTHALQVEPGQTKALGRIAEVIARGADRMGLSHGPLPRNAPGCPGAGECILGCPQGAKRSTDVSYIPDALKAGAELYVGLPVTRILKKGRRVVALEARGTDDTGASKVVRVFADRFVLGCGSLQTPVMLFDNDLGGPRVGKNLSVHPAMGVVAQLPEDLQPWAAIPQGYAVHGLEDQGIQFEGYYLPPQMLAATMPHVGPALTTWMDQFHRLGQFGFMVRDEGDGWVRRGPDGRPLIGYRLSERSRQRLTLAASRVAEIFIAAGATAVDPGIVRQPIISTREQARALAQARPNRMDFRLLGAHPLGTCAMGSSPERAVVDFEHRVFGTDNLHIVDGSVVPTSLGVNPQMTIMAFALRAADVIADLLERAQAA
ncbi:MAG: GMC family oxidoreductase, partial [Deltaproteobacteria bacterium]|nr:GMC family oxidoreductase [Deltaproteobacteria bacterium]